MKINLATKIRLRMQDIYDDAFDKAYIRFGLFAEIVDLIRFTNFGRRGK